MGGPVATVTGPPRATLAERVTHLEEQLAIVIDGYAQFVADIMRELGL